MISISVVDYAIFAVLLIGSGAIGVYYGSIKKSSTIAEYVTGGQSSIYPVIASIVITFTTPKHILTDPADVVMYGTQLISGILMGQVVACILFVTFILPIQMNLTDRSLLQYFQKRHSTEVRVVAAIVGSLRDIVVIPILIYAPCLVLREMMGLPMTYSAPVIVLICMFYTMLGGLRAVIWTDTLQYGFFVLSILCYIIIGTYRVGGPRQVWRDAEEGERLEFFDLGNYLLYDRANLWSACMTGGLYGFSIGMTNQSFYQRTFSVRRHSNPYRVVIMSYIGTLLSRAPGLIIGLIIYSYYGNCQPLVTKEIRRPDEISLLFVREMSENAPGVLGLFCSGTVAASLSTISTVFNTVSYTVHDDIILPLIRNKRLSKRQSMVIMNTCIALMGFTGLACVPLVATVSSLQQLTMSVVSMANGASLALYLSGMVNPWINNKGVIAGAVVGVITPTWMFYNCLDLMSEGKLIYYPKLLSTDGCNQTTRFHAVGFNNKSLGFRGYGTKIHADFDSVADRFGGVSFAWYSAIGVLTSLLVGILVSLITGVTDTSTVDPSLIVPQLRWLLPKQSLDRWRARQAGLADQEELKPLS